MLSGCSPPLKQNPRGRCSTLPSPDACPSLLTCFVVVKVKVNHVAHLFAAAVHIPGAAEAQGGRAMGDRGRTAAGSVSTHAIPRWLHC